MATQENIFLLMKVLHNYDADSCLSIERISEEFNVDTASTLQMINLGENLSYLTQKEKYFVIDKKYYKVAICMNYLYRTCHHGSYCVLIHSQGEYNLISKLLGFECALCGDYQRHINYMHSKYNRCEQELKYVKRELDFFKRRERDQYRNIPRARVVNRNEDSPRIRKYEDSPRANNEREDSPRVKKRRISS